MNYKEVEGFPNYIIFKTGKIWSKNTNRFMTPYPQVNKKTCRKDMKMHLSKDGKDKMFYLARLLGIAFIPNPLNLPQIDHIDRNSLNNDLSNLRWVTLEEQARNKGLYKTNKLGLRYIFYRRNHYEVQIVRHKYYKSFKTEEEALLQRNSFLDYIGEDYENIDV